MTVTTYNFLPATCYFLFLNDSVSETASTNARVSVSNALGLTVLEAASVRAFPVCCVTNFSLCSLKNPSSTCCSTSGQIPTTRLTSSRRLESTFQTNVWCVTVATAVHCTG